MSNHVSNHEKLETEETTLVVDLDGTLLLSDSLFESALRTLRTKWLTVFLMPSWLFKGKAHLKQELAKRGGIEVSGLPYNEPLVSYIRSQKMDGRVIALASACDASIANAIAEHFTFFDHVCSSNGIVNLKGDVKARLLSERFGKKGFAYAGNDASDLAVWEIARSAVVVNATRSVARKVRAMIPVELELKRPANRFLALLSAMRPYQWVKNSLVLIPPVAAHTILDPGTALAAVETFVAFCLVTSGVYLANDLADIDADRRHESKRLRPFASGTLPLSYGLWSPVLLTGGLLLAVLVSPLTGLIVVSYIALTTAYSLFLKTMPLIDVFVLSALYSMRIIAGAIATGTVVSVWLLSFSGFIFLALALLKRSAELIAMPSTGVTRRDYSQLDTNVVQTMGVASSFASSIILALYVDSDSARLIYPAHHMLWGIVPLILFWQCWLWLSTIRGYLDDDPIVYAARDWVSWVTFAVILILTASASFDSLAA